MVIIKIAPFSVIWFQWFFAIAVGFTVILYVGSNVAAKTKQWIATALAFFLLFNTVFIQFYIYSKGYWQLPVSMPLFHGNIMALMSAIALITRKQWFYEAALYLGIAGSAQAILSPGYTYGWQGYFFYEYFLSNAVTILAPLYLTIILKMKPRIGSWWRIVAKYFSLAFPLYLVNYLIGWNYMFMMEKPNVYIALNLGSWFFYFISWVLYFFVTAFFIQAVTERTHFFSRMDTE